MRNVFNFIVTRLFAASLVFCLFVSCKKDVCDSYEWIFINESGHDVTYCLTENSSLEFIMRDILHLGYWTGNALDPENSYTIAVEDPYLIYSYSGDPATRPLELQVVYDGKYSVLHKGSDGDSPYNNMCWLDDYEREKISLDDGSVLYRYRFTFTENDYEYAVANGSLIQEEDK